METTNLKISEIAKMVGYNDANYFYKVFKKYTGYRPSNYRKNFYNKNFFD